MSKSGLPAGVLVSPCLLKVVWGTVWVPIVNVRTAEILLCPRTDLGTLSAGQVLSLPAGVTEVGATVATGVNSVGHFFGQRQDGVTGPVGVNRAGTGKGEVLVAKILLGLCSS